MLVSGSWDRTLRLWDTSQRQNNGAGCVVLPEKVYSVSAAKNRIVVGMANRVIHIYDPRHMQEPLQIRESSLKYMTRAVACNPDGTGKAYTCFRSTNRDRLRNLERGRPGGDRISESIRRCTSKSVCLQVPPAGGAGCGCGIPGECIELSPPVGRECARQD